MADHAVSDQGIDAMKRPLAVQAEALLEGCYIRPETLKMASQQIELH